MRSCLYPTILEQNNTTQGKDKIGKVEPKILPQKDNQNKPCSIHTTKLGDKVEGFCHAFVLYHVSDG